MSVMDCEYYVKAFEKSPVPSPHSITAHLLNLA